MKSFFLAAVITFSTLSFANEEQKCGKVRKIFSDSNTYIAIIVDGEQVLFKAPKAMESIAITLATTAMNNENILFCGSRKVGDKELNLTRVLLNGDPNGLP